MEYDFLDFGDLTAGKKIIAENFTNWTSGNEVIDNFIREKQLNYNGIGTVFEWIPFSELSDIKEIEGSNFFAAAMLKNCPLSHHDTRRWIRKSYEIVALRFLIDIQNITDEFTNKVLNFSFNLIRILI
jgi:hypothetical protein